MLSNISIGFAKNYSSVEELKELFSLFDGLVFSGPIGKLKPHKEIFQHLLDTYNISADECIFIDDNLSNVMGANNAGINGYLFDRDLERLQKEIFLN